MPDMTDEEIDEALRFQKLLDEYDPEDVIPVRCTVAPKGDSCWNIFNKE